MEGLNWAGNILLAVCGIPLAYGAWRDKGIDINFYFLLAWTLGEVCVALYVLSLGETALTLNYICNIIALTVVWNYRRRT